MWGLVANIQYLFRASNNPIYSIHWHFFRTDHPNSMSPNVECGNVFTLISASYPSNVAAKTAGSSPQWFCFWITNMLFQSVTSSNNNITISAKPNPPTQSFEKSDWRNWLNFLGIIIYFLEALSACCFPPLTAPMCSQLPRNKDMCCHPCEALSCKPPSGRWLESTTWLRSMEKTKLLCKSSKMQKKKLQQKIFLAALIW